MQNPFADLIPGQTSPLFAPRPVYRQRPPEPAPQTPPQRRKDELDAQNVELQMQNTREQMQERRDKKALEDQQRQAQANSATELAMRAIRRIDRSAIDANDNGGLFETGTMGWLASPARGGAAYSLRRDLDLPGSIAAVDRLIQMRRESPTGAAVGNVTERELEMLKDTLGTVDPNQDHQTFLKNLAEAKQAFFDTMKKISPAAARSYLKSAPVGIWLKKDGGYQIGRLTGKRDERKRSGGVEFLGFEE